jgi:DNA-binding response OmpR family regulator
MKTKVLIIEDDPAILKGLEVSLRDQKYEVIGEGSGEAGYTRARSEKLDLIILDLILPDRDGMDICRDLRKEGIDVPIIMLTNRKDEMDKVLGFELGADDYVTKPFSMRELQARIKALLRRKSEIGKEIESCSFGDIALDFKKLEASKRGSLIKLSLKEFEVLKYFIKHEGEVITRDMLLDKVWGYQTFPTTRTVDNYILMLRKKIEDNPSEPKHILTFHSAGYKFVR